MACSPAQAVGLLTRCISLDSFTKHNNQETNLQWLAIRHNKAGKLSLSRFPSILWYSPLMRGQKQEQLFPSVQSDGTNQHSRSASSPLYGPLAILPVWMITASIFFNCTIISVKIIKNYHTPDKSAAVWCPEKIIREKEEERSGSSLLCLHSNSPRFQQDWAWSTTRLSRIHLSSRYWRTARGFWMTTGSRRMTAGCRSDWPLHSGPVRCCRPSEVAA